MASSLFGNITGSKEALIESLKQSLQFNDEFFHKYITNSQFTGYKIDNRDIPTTLLIKPDMNNVGYGIPAIHSVYVDNLNNMVGGSLKDLYILDNYSYSIAINNQILTIFRLKHPENYDENHKLVIKDLNIFVGTGIHFGSTKHYNNTKLKSTRSKPIIAVLASECSKIKFENCTFKGSIGLTIIDDIDAQNKELPYIVPVNINEFEQYSKPVFFDGNTNKFPGLKKNHYIIVSILGSKPSTNLIKQYDFGEDYNRTEDIIIKNMNKRSNQKFYNRVLGSQYNFGNVNITRDLCGSLYDGYFPNYPLN